MPIFACAPADGKGNHAIDAGRGQQQSDRGEGAKQPGVGAAGPERVVEALRHGVDFEHGQVRIHLANHLSRRGDQSVRVDRAANRDRHRIGRADWISYKHAGPPLPVEAVVRGIAHHADHLHPVFGEGVTDALAYAILAGPKPLDETLVDDGDGRLAWLLIALIEGASADESEAHGFEIAGHGADAEDHRVFLIWTELARAFGGKEVTVVPTERNQIRGRNAFHSRDAFHVADQVVVEDVATGCLLVLFRR